MNPQCRLQLEFVFTVLEIGTQVFLWVKRPKHDNCWLESQSRQLKVQIYQYLQDFSSQLSRQLHAGPGVISLQSNHREWRDCDVKLYLATLDLEGPSMIIDTACSTEFVASHTVSRNLRSRESELAIVDGESALLIPGIRSCHLVSSMFNSPLSWIFMLDLWIT